MLFGMLFSVYDAVRPLYNNIRYHSVGFGV